MNCQRGSISGSNHYRQKCCSSRTNKLFKIAMVLSFVCFSGMINVATADDNTFYNDDFIDDARHDQNGLENNKDNLSNRPTPRPSVTPSSLPSSNPSTLPTVLPSVNPTKAPSSAPSGTPTNMPSSVPSLRPSGRPTGAPTSLPSVSPSTSPSNDPTVVPTSLPSHVPSLHPTLLPSSAPSSNPTRSPSVTPTLKPSRRPSTSPTSMPSLQPSDAPSDLPTVIPTALPSTVPTRLPSFHPSQSPSGEPTAAPSTIPTLLPSSKPSIDCELGFVYGDERGTPLELVFQYEITFDGTKTTPASEYIERVILPYLREVFAESLVLTRSNSTNNAFAYCGDECHLRRSRLRAENVPITRHLEVSEDADRKRTTAESKPRVLQTGTNTNNTLLFETQVDTTFNTTDGVGNTDRAVNGVIGIQLDSTSDEIDFFQNCTTTNNTSCVRINGNLRVYLDSTPLNDFNLVENQLQQQLRQAMNENVYVCDKDLLPIQTVSYVEPDDTVPFIRETDDSFELTPTSASGGMSYGLIGGGVVLGLLGMMLMFVRKRQSSEVDIDDEDSSVYGNAPPSAISEDITWLAPV